MRIWIVIFMACLPGCVSLSGSSHKSEVALLPVPPQIPRELQKTTLPEYVIEPPDILRIEVARIVPKSPYMLGPGDGLLVQVAHADGTLLLNEVINVELDGSLQFGSPFDDPNSETDPEQRIDGPINVGGIDMNAARKLVTDHIGKTIADPSVRVSLDAFAAQQAISGEHLVASDGTVTLGAYGRVRVTGLTVEEARNAINTHLEQYLQLPNASIDVYAYNSKNYYIILQGAGLGDRVEQFPVKGNETVLDALSNVAGLSGTSSEEIWVSRPGRNIFDGHQVLPVDYRAVTQLADTRTNYQIMPGDRVFVREDKLIAADTRLGKLIAPVERIFGVVILGTDAVSRIEFYRQRGALGGLNGGL